MHAMLRESILPTPFHQPATYAFIFHPEGDFSTDTHNSGGSLLGIGICGATMPPCASSADLSVIREQRNSSSGEELIKELDDDLPNSL